MYFQTPKPFGQQSTSFRPVGNVGGGMRSACSLSALPTSTFDIKKTGFSDDFSTSLYDSSATFVVNKNQRRIFTVTNDDGNVRQFVQKGPIGISVENNLDNTFPVENHSLQKDRSYDHSVSYRPAPPTRPKVFTPRKTVSLTDALSDDMLLPGFSGWENMMRSNQNEARKLSELSESETAFYSPLFKSSSISSTTSSNFLRCRSEDPSVNKVVSEARIPIRMIPEEGLSGNKIGVFRLPSEKESENLAAKKDDGYGKSNNALRQRHTSDNSLKYLKAHLPSNVSTDIMLNAALGVKAELEKDPKFRNRAENLKNNRLPVRVSQPGGYYKQSPSFIHLQGYLLNSESVLQPPLISSTFTPEKVHDLFARSNEAPFAVVSPSPRDSAAGFNSYSVITEKTVAHDFPEINPIAKDNARIVPVVIRTEKVGDSKVSASSHKTTNFLNDLSELKVTSGEKVTVVDDSTRNWNRGTAMELSTNQPGDSSVCFSGDSMNSPPSILVRNASNFSSENTVKPVKRVVFQCDANLVRKLSPAESLGAENLSSEQSVGSGETPASITQYDEAVEEPLSQFKKLSEQIGGDVKTAGELVASAFATMRCFVWNASGQAAPAAADLSGKLAPISQGIEKIGALASSKRNTTYFNHLSALSDGIPAIGWLSVKPTPGPYVKEMRDAAMFYVNRVLKEYRDGDKTHVQWAKSWVELLNALEKYVRQVHTTGLVWNSCPGAVCPDSGSVAETASDAASGAPSGAMPPPPVIPANFAEINTKSQGSSNDRAALFAELNKGSDITKGLRKVTKDMQTHKNPALRAQSPVKKGPSKEAASSAAAAQKKAAVEKPPKTYLENGKQWNVEYYKNRNDLVIDITDLKQTVYILKCENCVVQIKGKLNSVMVDNCKKTSVVFDNLLSQIEVINCKSVQVQAMGSMPTISIQQTDGCQVYLSKDSLDTEIITSKSSQMNVSVPTDVEGDFTEFPVPEQFKTTYENGKLKTVITELA